MKCLNIHKRRHVSIVGAHWSTRKPRITVNIQFSLSLLPSLSALTYSCRLEGTVSKLEAQMSMLAMNKNIGQLTKQLQKTLSNNELLKASKVMEDFDKALENLELQGNNMSSVMNQQTAQATPQNQVQDLLNEIADNQGMQLRQEMPGAPAQLVEKQEEDSLEARMRSLQS
jgi:charged multivesicular body protein 1